MTLIYRFIVLIVMLLVIWNLFDEDKLKNQANAAIVIIPLLLRVLMIK